MLKLTEKADAVQTTEMLMTQLGLAKGQVRQLQDVPMMRLLEAYDAISSRVPLREPGARCRRSGPHGC